MRLKLDENLPESLLPALGALGHDVDNHKQDPQAGVFGEQARETTGFGLVTWLVMASRTSRRHRATC
jgi:hypothetical protein